MHESFKVSAPGKLMLLGEHAVLKGKNALVCAVNQGVTIICKKRYDKKINIISSLGEYTTELSRIKIDTKFQFVLTALSQQQKKIPSGFDFKIESDFTANIGLGSSAAVTAAIMAAIFVVSEQEINKTKIFECGMKTIHKVQGTGSGADLAASIFGGILLYRMEPFYIKPLKSIFPITVVYSGSKLPTTMVINIVEEKYKQNVEFFSAIYNVMDQSVPYAVKDIERNNWNDLGEIFNINQGLMDAIGVNNLVLSEINYKLREDTGIYGTKISGSGLGDCVIGVGILKQRDFPYQVIPLEISSKGIVVE